MAYYNICPKCGATLDPGEHCDCESQIKKSQEFFEQNTKINPETGQLFLRLDGKSMEKGGTG